MPKKRIILDTNFLLAAYQFKIDIISEIEKVCDFSYSLFIIDKTVDEIDFLAGVKSGRDKEAAKWAKKILEKNKIEKITTDSEKYVDDLIASEIDTNTIVATQDQALKKTATPKGVHFTHSSSEKAPRIYK